MRTAKEIFDRGYEVYRNLRKQAPIPLEARPMIFAAMEEYAQQKLLSVDGLPSDEEITKEAEKRFPNGSFKYPSVKALVFIEAAAWLRSQLTPSKSAAYTEEDMMVIRNKIVAMMPTGDVTAWDLIKTVADYTKWFDNYIQSLTPAESRNNQEGGEG